jgi:hypothetical protein
VHFTIGKEAFSFSDRRGAYVLTSALTGLGMVTPIFVEAMLKGEVAPKLDNPWTAVSGRCTRVSFITLQVAPSDESL